MTATDTHTSLGGGVGAVMSAAGLTVTTGADVGTVMGPLLVGDVTDGDGQLIGVVAIADSGDGADALIAEAVQAAAVELGGAGAVGTPVGSGAEVGARFTMPVTSVVWSGADGTASAAYVTRVDRRSGSGAPSTGPAAAASPGTGGGAAGGLDKLVNVSLEVSVELGRTRVTLADVLNYDVGATIELDRAAGAPVDIRVNDTLLAQGEVVLIDDEYAVRITAILDPNRPRGQ